MAEVDYASQFNIYPVSDPVSFRYYLTQNAQMWPAKEVRIGLDKEQFDKLPTRYQELVYDILAFFAPGDGLISQQILGFLNRTENFGQQAFLLYQAAIEVTHAHAYSDAIMTFCNRKKRREVFKAVNSLPCVKAKADFIYKYMSSDEYPLSVKYLAGAIAEGIFFVSLFSIIFYLKDKNLLDRFGYLNIQVSKDEFVHRNFNIMMAYKHGITDALRKTGKVELTETIVRNMLNEALKIERDHVEYLLREPINSVQVDEMEGMTIENNMRYVYGLADQIVNGLKYNPMFTVPESVVLGLDDTRVHEIELPWMKKMSWMNKTNFYEGDPDGYTAGSLQDMLDEFERMMRLAEAESSDDDDFQHEKIAEAFSNPLDVDI